MELLNNYLIIDYIDEINHILEFLIKQKTAKQNLKLKED